MTETKHISKNKRNKMTKDTIPEGFSLTLALVDLVPVIFFGLSAVRVGNLFHSGIFMFGAVVCMLSGLIKVLWKIIAALSQKNIWPMFIQMRIFMPIGFLLMILALFVDQRNLNASAAIAGILSFPSSVLFALGFLGMAMMFVFAFRMDSSDPKVNWLEQITNSVSQILIFVGLMLI